MVPPNPALIRTQPEGYAAHAPVGTLLACFHTPEPGAVYVPATEAAAVWQPAASSTFHLPVLAWSQSMAPLDAIVYIPRRGSTIVSNCRNTSIE